MHRQAVEVNIRLMVAFLEVLEDLDELEQLLLTPLERDGLQYLEGFADQLVNLGPAKFDLVRCSLELVDPFVLKVVDLSHRCIASEQLKAEAHQRRCQDRVRILRL